MEINQIYRGDCLEMMKDIPDNSIDCIICDLPYGKTCCEWDVVIPFEPIWEQYRRITKNNAAIVLFGAQPFTSKLIMSNEKMFRCEWIWDKGRGSNPFIVNKAVSMSHENILIFGKKSPNYYPQMGDGKPYYHKANKNMVSGVLGSVYISQDKEYTGRYPLSIIKNISIHNGSKLQPTQKPVALIEYLIRTYSLEGETILDNCAGSGTTGIACQNLNRNYILMEKDITHFNIAKKRIEENRIRLEENKLK